MVRKIMKLLTSAVNKHVVILAETTVRSECSVLFTSTLHVQGKAIKVGLNREYKPIIN